MGPLLSSPPKPPGPPAPTPMPDLADPGILAAQKKVLQDAALRSGRASTVLSGGDEFSGTRLGTP